MKSPTKRTKEPEKHRAPTLSIRNYNKRRKTKLARRIEKDWRALRKGLDYYEG